MQLQYGEEVLDVTWTQQQGTRLLVVTHFDEFRNKIVDFYDFPFDPYCFCYMKDIEAVSKVASVVDPTFTLTPMDPKEVISWDGEPIAKLETYLPRSIGEIRNLLWFGTAHGKEYAETRHQVKLLEADVKYGKRVIIDMLLNVYKKQKIGYVDIETDPRERSGILDVNNPPFRLLSAGIVNEEGEETWLCEDNENKLFEQYAKELDKYSVVCSWTNYDVKYPWGRARRIGHHLKNKFRIPSIDLMSSFAYYSRMASTRGSSRFVSLTEACKRLDIPMEDFGAKQNIKIIWDWFMTDRPKLKKYNMEDARVLLEIDKKLLLSSGHLDMSVYLNIPVADTVSNNYAIDILGLRMAFLNKPRLVLPCKPISFMTREDIKKRGGTKGGYKGAIVLKPVPGTHRWVACFDFKSLYPTLMRALNMGLDSLRKDGDVGSAKARFRSTPRSILVKVLDVIGKWKEDLTKVYDEATPGTFEKFKAYARRRVAKTLYCAVSGVMGSIICRFFNLDVIESVTLTGQDCVCAARDYSTEIKLLLVLYGDTDSIFVELPVKTKEEALAYAMELEKELSEAVSKFGEQVYGTSIDVPIETDFIADIFYMSPGSKKKKKRGVKKKHLAHVIWEKKWCDYVSIVGFELKRRDWTGIAKTVQKKCFDLILQGLEKQEILIQLRPFIDDLKVKLYTGKIPDKELIFTKGITRPLNEYKAVQKGHRPPPHVAAALIAAEKGFLDPREVSYVVTSYRQTEKGKCGRMKGPKLMFVEPILESGVPEIQQTGYDYYWEKQVLPILERLDLALTKAENMEQKTYHQVKFFLLGNL